MPVSERVLMHWMNFEDAVLNLERLSNFRKTHFELFYNNQYWEQYRQLLLTYTLSTVDVNHSFKKKRCRCIFSLRASHLFSVCFENWLLIPGISPSWKDYGKYYFWRFTSLTRSVKNDLKEQTQSLDKVVVAKLQSKQIILQKKIVWFFLSFTYLSQTCRIDATKCSP